MDKHEIGICDDKIEINIKLRLKVDPKSGFFYLKHIKLDHQEV